jgi:hypothetical protein
MTSQTLENDDYSSFDESSGDFFRSLELDDINVVSNTANVFSDFGAERKKADNDFVGIIQSRTTPGNRDECWTCTASTLTDCQNSGKYSFCNQDQICQLRLQHRRGLLTRIESVCKERKGIGRTFFEASFEMCIFFNN